MTSFQEAFEAFSKFGDTKSDGKSISLSQSDKWMKQAKVLDSKITTTDTGIAFKKFKAQRLALGDYNKFLEDLASTKKVKAEDLKNKMVTCGSPGLTSNLNKTPAKVSETVARLTDQSKYTGTHKQRFDSEGRGRGLAGRVDVQDQSGYVAGYKNKNTYGKSAGGAPTACKVGATSSEGSAPPPGSAVRRPNSATRQSISNNSQPSSPQPATAPESSSTGTQQATAATPPPSTTSQLTTQQTAS